MHKQIKQLYEFGPFHLDVDERLLMRGGRVVPLSPKVFETLLVLVENNGRILGKVELMQTLWPDTFVEESNLTQNISQIRRALSDGTSDFQYIETIPKRGYRFVAQVLSLTSHEKDLAFAGSGNELRAGASVEGFNVAQGKSTTGGAATVHDNAQPMTVEFSTLVADNVTNNKIDVRATIEAASSPPNPKRMHVSVAILLVSLAILTVALLVAYRRSNNQAKTAFRQINPSKLTTSGKAMLAAVSRDGKYASYVAQDGDLQSLCVRQVATTSHTTVVAPAEVSFHGVTFSPDDNFLYYVVRVKGAMFTELYQVPVLGGTPKKVVSEVDSPISFSPDGQYFTFVRNNRQQRAMSLIVARHDGSEERKLVTRKRPENLSLLGPSWSPDGSLIACGEGSVGGAESTMRVIAVSVADGTAQPMGNQTWSVIGQVAWLGDGSGIVLNAWRRNSAFFGDQLWLVDYASGEARRITYDMTNYDGVSLSADSGVLLSNRLDRVSRIAIVPANGGDLDTANATQDQSGFGDNYSELFGLDWTPDGQLVYTSQASGNLDVWITTSDRKQQKQLTRDPLTDYMPIASADGRYIVFISDRSGYRSVWRMEVDGSSPIRLTSGPSDVFPSLSPDGRWVVYTSLIDGNPRLWKVPIEGSAPVELTRELTSRPVVSPDGKWIVCYYQGEKDPRARVALIPFVGGEPVVVEGMAPPEFQIVRWSPDSRALTYISTRQGVSNIWSKPIDGGEARQLTDFTTDQIFRFAWSRDGKFLACERGMEISDVVLISSMKPE